MIRWQKVASKEKWWDQRINIYAPYTTISLLSSPSLIFPRYSSLSGLLPAPHYWNQQLGDQGATVISMMNNDGVSTAVKFMYMLDALFWWATMHWTHSSSNKPPPCFPRLVQSIWHPSHGRSAAVVGHSFWFSALIFSIPLQIHTTVHRGGPELYFIWGAPYFQLPH